MTREFTASDGKKLQLTDKTDEHGPFVEVSWRGGDRFGIVRAPSPQNTKYAIQVEEVRPEINRYVQEVYLADDRTRQMRNRELLERLRIAAVATDGNSTDDSVLAAKVMLLFDSRDLGGARRATSSLSDRPLWKEFKSAALYILAPDFARNAFDF